MVKLRTPQITSSKVMEIENFLVEFAQAWPIEEK